MFTAVRKLRAQRQGMIQELVSDMFLYLRILEIFLPFLKSVKAILSTVLKLLVMWVALLAAHNPRNTAQTVSRVRPQLWL